MMERNNKTEGQQKEKADGGKHPLHLKAVYSN